MELSSPLTVYWDLPDPAGSDLDLSATAENIIACSPLMVQIMVPAGMDRDALLSLLGRFRQGPAVILTLPPDLVHTLADASLDGVVLRELLLSVGTLIAARDSVPGLVGLATRLTPVPVTGISFPVTAGNWSALPDLIQLCRKAGLPRLVLPMQRLYGDEEPFLLTRHQQEELSMALESAGGVAGIALTIHDPFLWRAFHPDLPFPQGGCQAANTMIAIAPDGRVYPCPTLPVVLGDVSATPLGGIISSSAKKELRRSLLLSPAACSGCAELASCRGGCRGRALVLGSLDELDPACR